MSGHKARWQGYMAGSGEGPGPVISPRQTHLRLYQPAHPHLPPSPGLLMAAGVGRGTPDTRGMWGDPGIAAAEVFTRMLVLLDILITRPLTSGRSKPGQDPELAPRPAVEMGARLWRIHS